MPLRHNFFVGSDSLPMTTNSDAKDVGDKTLGCYLGGGGSLAMPDPWKYTKGHPQKAPIKKDADHELRAGAVAASQLLASDLSLATSLPLE